MTPRCIAFLEGRRCPRHPAKRNGDLFVCTQHSTMWTLLLIDDTLAPPTRRMLAHSRWETAREGQALIDRMHRRRAA